MTHVCTYHPVASQQSIYYELAEGRILLENEPTLLVIRRLVHP